ncbi:MAG: calcium/sodium antiporter [Desulfobacterales bacterium]|nr:calcium/sodium antiporter [Desulfobacterales bacterium]
MLNWVFFVIGVLMLYYGAEWLVKGSSSFARTLGIKPIVIGLTIVAFGTSAPELVVSLVSSIKGKSMIAVGNVVGSNICNIALILGLAALFQPIKSDSSVIKRDIPIMLLISFYLLIVTLNSTISRLEGASLLVGIILYTFLNYYIANRESKLGTTEPVSAEFALEGNNYIGSRSKQIILIVTGIAGVIIGANILIDSAIKIMKVFGVSEKFIGLTIVAFGTSLPELATSVVAALRKEMDISIGNLVGSNVFNILSVIGAAALVKPIPIPGGFIESGLIIDYLAMIFTSALPLLMMRKTCTIRQRDGVILIGCYAIYLIYLIMKSSA